MSGRYVNPELNKDEQREVEKQQDSRRQQQPYATELDNRELEHAHKDKRPVESPDESSRSDEPGRAVSRCFLNPPEET